MPETWIIDACRTPRSIGKHGKGALSTLHLARKPNNGPVNEPLMSR